MGPDKWFSESAGMTIILNLHLFNNILMTDWVIHNSNYSYFLILIVQSTCERKVHQGGRWAQGQDRIGKKVCRLRFLYDWRTVTMAKMYLCPVISSMNVLKRDSRVWELASSPQHIHVAETITSFYGQWILKPRSVDMPSGIFFYTNAFTIYSISLIQT